MSTLEWFLWPLKYGGILFFFAIYGCNPSANSDKDIDSGANHVESIYPEETAHLGDEELARIYCSSCHTFPLPEILGKGQWQEGVLPNMGYRLGIKTIGHDPYKNMSFRETSILQKAGIFPSQPLISNQDWARLVSYYIDHAPDKLSNVEIAPVDQSLTLFNPKPFFLGGNTQALITMIVYQDPMIYVGDRRGYLYLINTETDTADSLFLDFPPSDIIRSPDSTLSILTLGAMDPNDLSQGELLKLLPSSNKRWTAETLDRGLSRPVHLNFTDLNNDELEEIVVCSFGNQMGRVSWYGHSDNGMLEEHLIKSVPGAIRSEAYDFNQDQWTDIMVLFGQGDEGVSIFYNQGDGSFEESKVLGFHPAYGSSDFKLVDFNGDGFMDLICTNGDNADHSYSLKPYHGVRIYLNAGNNEFNEAYFYPMHGASKVEVADFDLDGDLDIAAISFFPDFEEQPLRNFVFLENQGGLKFKARSLPDVAGGSWLVMDKADWDQDGDQDLLLGSFTLRLTPTPEGIQDLWKTNNWKLLVLENTALTR